MFHYFGVCTNQRGDALKDWQIEVIAVSTGAVVDIYSDENSTPIAAVSGITNRAKSDESGNYDFFVESGDYSINFYNEAGVFQSTQRYLPMYGADNATAASGAATSAAASALAAASSATAAANSASGFTSPTGAANVGFTASGTNKTARTVATKLGDWLSVPDFTTPALADAAATMLTVPAAVTTTVANGGALSSVYTGPAQITTADGNKRGRYFSRVSAAPASLGNHDSIDTAFNGDVSKCLFPVEHRITGAGALGTPTTGYVYTPEAYPHYTVSYIEPSAGHNQSTTSNVGRTGYAQWRGNLKHYGNGDAAVFNGSVLVAGSKAGATSVLAQPAGVIVNGDMTAAADNVYLNSLEFYMRDAGFDVAAAGPVINLERTNATGSQSAFWYGARIQSKGSASIDAAYSATGKMKVGVDFAGGAVDLGTNLAAISMEAGHRIYFNNASSNGFFTDTFNGDFISYIGGNIVFANTGAAVMQIAADRVIGNRPFVPPIVTVASLPTANSGNRGMEYCVTDATATTRYSTVAGGGSNFVKVLCNGTNWIIQ